MVELTTIDHGELLRKYLLRLPCRFEFDFSDAARIDLRRALYYVAADGGRYIKSFFPDVDEELLPNNYAQVIMSDKCPSKEPQNFFLERSERVDPRHPNRSCARKFKKGEPVYRCVTCGHDDSSGLCVDCFDEEFHKDHEVILNICQREFGGVCDCGNPDVWKRDLHCKNFHVEEKPTSELPERFKCSIFHTIEIVLDYIVDVMAGSTASIVKGHRDCRSIVYESLGSDLLTERYFGKDWNSDKFYLLLYNDQNKQYRDAIQRITLTTKKVPEFATMVADEVNSSGRAKVLGSSNIDELVDAQKTLEATGLSSCIRSARDIFREEMCADMIQWLTDITTGFIDGNHNMTRDLLLRAICSPWSTGVTTYPLPEDNSVGFLDYDKIPNVSVSSRDSSNPKSANWKFIPNTWNIDQSIADECRYDRNFSFNAQDKRSFHGSRFQYLLYFDIRYWKSFRVVLHNLFNSVLTSNLKYKYLLCCQYIDLYPTMLKLFFLHDREPESSCMTTLNQLLTPRGTATLIAEHGDLTRLLAAAYSFLSSLSVSRPCDVDTSLGLSSIAFKNRKVGQVFFDICCILLNSKNVENILSSQFINQVCDVLELFQGRPTLKREAVEHVEYENNDYGLYFNIYSVISSLSEMVAKSFLNSPNPPGSFDLISLSFYRLFMVLMSNQDDNDTNDISKLDIKPVETLEGVKDITQFKVHANLVSFLHPMHSFLTWMLQYSKVTNVSQIKALQDLKGDDMVYRLLIEHPLRVIVMLSQIKIGFWVRNGFSIRTQLHIYKNSGIRESGYRRDLFMVQFIASVADPNLILMTIFSRWSLLPWLKEDFGNHDDYDEATVPLIVEECLLFFIHLLTETTYLSDPTEIIDKRLTTEIIHALCFKPLTYSKLCAEVPDFLVHEKRFELVLKKVADYVPPSSFNQSGIYKLKETLFDEVNPYYIYYSSNKREDAEKTVKERVSKRLKVPENEAFITPKPKSLEGTLFKDLFKLTASKNFVQFLKSTLKYINNEGIQKSDTILNFTLHLIHLVIEGKELSYAREFSENIWSELTADHNEPFYYESVGSLLYKFLKDDDYASHHSKIRAIFRTLKQKDRTVESYLLEQVQSFDASVLGSDMLSPPPTASSDFERKKKLARERRERIMAKFKQQQCQFVEKNKIEGNSTDTDAEMDDNDEIKGWKYPEEHCILCQMPRGPNDIFGVVFNALSSSSFRSVPFEDTYWTLKAFDDGHDHFNSKLYNYYDDVKKNHVVGPEFPINKFNCSQPNVVASSCGHGMHFRCFKDYLLSSKSRQTQITRTVPEDFENMEYVCPLCKSLGNLFVPILWNCNKNSLQKFLKPDPEWYKGFELLKHSSFSDPEGVTEFTNSLIEDVIKSLKGIYKTSIFEPLFAKALASINIRISNMMAKLAQPQFREYLAKLISNTISSTEIALRGRGNGSSVVTQLSNQTLTTLRTLVEYKKTWLALVAKNHCIDNRVNGSCVKIADEVLGKLTFLSSDRVFEVFDDVDFFDFLVSCFPTKDISNNSIYRLCYTGTIIQILSTLLSQLREELFEDNVGLFDLNLLDVSSQTGSNILALARQIRDNHPVFDNLPDDIFEDNRFPQLIFTLLNKAVTPFLRKVAIWTVASCADSEGVEMNAVEDEQMIESSVLTQYLNLPSVEEMIDLFNDSKSFESSKFSGFVQYIQTTDNYLRFSKLEYPGIVRLIDIPKRLDDIFTKLIYTNPKLKAKNNIDPAICLFCGKVVNLQKSSCGEVQGECNNHHENECLSDFGIFLLAKHSAILLLHKGNGSFHSAPYIDSHGEHDSDARQGQILTLSKEKYDDFIRKMWLQHDIPNYVTRKLEGILDIGGWETL